jgi:hypothetical protein
MKKLLWLLLLLPIFSSAQTTYLRLNLPSFHDTRWDVTTNANWNTLDSLLRCYGTASIPGTFAYFDGATWQCVPGNNTGSTKFLQETGIGAPSWSVGGVSTFSSGTLAPLFTTSVSNAGSTPALSFTLSNAAAHTFFGNNTGSLGAPSYSSIGPADLPGLGTLSGSLVIGQTPLTTVGDIGYAGAGPALARLAGNITTTKKFLTQTGNGAASAAPGWGVLSGSDLPNPSASTLGGVQSYVAVLHQWINSISTSGVPISTQPAFTDISGTLGCGQAPALSGDVTSSAGSCATTLPSIVSGATNTKVTYNAKGQITGGTQAAFSDIGRDGC